MTWSRTSAAAWVARLLALVLLAGVATRAPAQAQREPELRASIEKALASPPCVIEGKYDLPVWFMWMEPRIQKLVKDPAERMHILETVFCEAHRPGEQRLPPGLVMAVIDVESRFDRWAISSAGAVGLMQVMPFWPEELGMQRHQLVHVEANIRMGCAILRHYLKREKNDMGKALARYNGSVGRRTHSDLVVTRWTSRWNGADELGMPRSARR